MVAKLKITSRSAGAIRHVGTVVRSVNPEAIAKALGAEIVSKPQDDFAALRRGIVRHNRRAE